MAAYTVAANPTASEDVTHGYKPGDTWRNTTSNAQFVCLFNFKGAAVWATDSNFVNNEFDAGVVAVGDAVNYVAVATIQAGGRDIVIHGTVGAGGAIAHLKVTMAVQVGGTHKDMAVDADLDVRTVMIPWLMGSSIHQTVGDGTFSLRLAAGAGEYSVYAKKATNTTTLRIQGRVL